MAWRLTPRATSTSWTANLRIRVVNTQASRITVAGVVIAAGDIATVAGNGTRAPTVTAAAATSAQFSLPFGVAVDSAGNFYIADTSNLRIRKVDTNGIINTVAGGGSGCGNDRHHR